MNMVNSRARFDANQIEMAELQKTHIDNLFDNYSERGFRSVAIKHGTDPSVPSVETPIRDPATTAARLTRQMSRWALKNKLPPQVQGKRQFFRTWVRAVRR
jgi:hypothetical protein